jgi:hypothetical protein
MIMIICLKMIRKRKFWLKYWNFDLVSLSTLVIPYRIKLKQEIHANWSFNMMEVLSNLF